jgi:hypothetical protein
LIYVLTNRENGAMWEEVHTDTAGTADALTLTGPDILTRTIRLAGAVIENTVLEQKILVDTIPDALIYSSTPWLKSGSQFDSLESWWRKHAEDLSGSAIEITGFRRCNRLTADGAAINDELVHELIGGSITDWMENYQGIVKEEQIVSAYIAYEVTSPSDATKKSREVHRFTARILATNAQQRTYNFVTDNSYTEPEAIPSGLAASVLAAIDTLPWDGRFELVEQECTGLARVGKVVNLTGSLTAWATMAALVQRVKFMLDAGRTEITVGPPRQIGPDDLVEIYRVNRYRERVTSYMTRTTGKSGSAATVQGMGYVPAGATKGSAVKEPAQIVSGDLTESET